VIRVMLSALLLGGVVALAASCMGLRQINELAIVSAVGLELGEKPGTVRVSVQIIRPADARGQTGAPAGGTGEPVYSVRAEGKSIFDAIRNLGRFTSRRVYWSHNFVIVMQEKYARKGIKEMVDFFTRNHELRMDTWVAVTPDSPEELISTITGLEVVPGEAVDKLFYNNDVAGHALGSNMMNLEEAMLSGSAQPVLAKIQLQPRGISNKKPGARASINQVELAGAAAFRGDRMVGWLSPKETRGVMFFLEKLESGIEVVDCPNGGGVLTMEFKNARLRVVPSYRNGKPEFTLRLRADADMVESGCDGALGEIRDEARSKLEEELASSLRGALNKAQKTYRSDFLKLGDTFRNKYPSEWRTLRHRWNETLSEAETEVKVKVVIKSAVVKAERTNRP